MKLAHTLTASVGLKGSFPLSHYVVGRDNNFNLIRILAATLVLISHSYALSLGDQAEGLLKRLIGMDLGNIAVDVFFVTSGFLVTGSLLKKKSIMVFCRARIMRIYPALLVCIAISVFIIGPWGSTLSIYEYFTHTETVTFLVKNAILFSGPAFHLPGVFNENPVSNVVNGSLWTLPWEVRLYLYLAIIGIFVFQIRERLKRDWMAVLLAVSCITFLVVHITNYFVNFTGNDGPRVVAMFFMGSAYFVLRDHIQLSRRVCCAAVFLLFIASLHRTGFFLAYTVIIPYLVFGLAYLPSGLIRKFNGFGDYSYGMYIYGFPIQQSLLALFGPINIFELFVASFAMTFLLAFMSWHLIEKRFLVAHPNFVIEYKRYPLESEKC